MKNIEKIGYKQTELGLIPEDWEITEFIKFSSSEKNSFVNGPFGSDLLSSELISEGIPVVYIRDINNGRYKRKSTVCVSVEKSKKLSSCKTDFGDIIITKVGDPPCEAAIYNVNQNAVITQDVIRIKPAKNINPVFLCSLINSDIGKKQIEKIIIEGTRRRVSLTELKKIKLIKPPLLEQQKIAQILSIWDNSIEKTEKLIKTKTKFKKSLMQQLLTGKKRFKEFIKSDKYVQTEIGLLPEDWKIVKLGDIFERITRKNVELNQNSLTISAQYGLINQLDFFNKSVSANDLSGYYLLEKGDFAYNKSYSNGYPMGVIRRLEKYDKGVVSTLYICFKLKCTKSIPEYYLDYFESGYFNNEIVSIAKEGGRAHGLLNVGVNEFFNLLLPKPSFEEQQKIASVLNTAEKELNILKKNLENLRQQKKGLMQKLLTGQIRVKIDNDNL